MSEILASGSLSPGPDEVDQCGPLSPLKNSPLMMSLTKTLKPKTKKFFQCWLKDLPSLFQLWTAH